MSSEKTNPRDSLSEAKLGSLDLPAALHKRLKTRSCQLRLLSRLSKIKTAGCIPKMCFMSGHFNLDQFLYTILCVFIVK